MIFGTSSRGWTTNALTGGSLITRCNTRGKIFSITCLMSFTAHFLSLCAGGRFFGIRRLTGVCIKPSHRALCLTWTGAVCRIQATILFITTNLDFQLQLHMQLVCSSNSIWSFLLNNHGVNAAWKLLRSCSSPGSGYSCQCKKA